MLSTQKDTLTSANFSRKLQSLLQWETERPTKSQQRKAGFKKSIGQLQDKVRELLKDPGMEFERRDQDQNDDNDHEDDIMASS